MKALHLFAYLGIVLLFVGLAVFVQRYVVDIALVPPTLSLSAPWWQISLAIIAWLCLVGFFLMQLTSLFYFFSEGTDDYHDVLKVSLVGTILPYTLVLVMSNLASVGVDAESGRLAHARSRSAAGAGGDLNATEENTRATLDEVQVQLRDDIAPAIDRLETDAGDLKVKLRKLGVRRSADLEGNYRAQALARELAEVVGYLRLLREKKQVYEKAEFDLETMLRRLKRRQLVEDAGLSADELSEVRLTLKRIDGRLADVAEAQPEIDSTQLDALIDAELGR